ncbi:MAG TPA: hypothetical protein VJ793_06430 [Anaerolineae bacterium]|nr:hypothetical protein [Anaerolineae bacterium]
MIRVLRIAYGRWQMADGMSWIARPGRSYPPMLTAGWIAKTCQVYLSSAQVSDRAASATADLACLSPWPTIHAVAQSAHRLTTFRMALYFCT